MKKLVLLLLFSIGISYVYAGKFKVLFVNDASLKYTNGKVVKVGDTFKSAEDINWTDDLPRQGMDSQKWFRRIGITKAPFYQRGSWTARRPERPLYGYLRGRVPAT